MKHRINSTGNILEADQAFMDLKYPGDYTFIPEVPIVVPRMLSVADLIDRFTDDEWDDFSEMARTPIALYTPTTRKVAGWYTRLQCKREVNLDGDFVINGLQRLKNANLLNNAAIARIRA